MSFAVDQLVEIAIRALSPAVNDTFTALTCIDWLGASMCKVTANWHPVRVHRDGHGFVRLITSHVSYQSLIERAFEKIRQAGRGMPAVLIRQLDALAKIADHQPDIVFVDIMMPRLDGYQTCALIKHNKVFRSIPVIMLSSKDGLFDRARGRIVGSEHYLTKPFTKDELLGAIESHIGR